MQSVGIFSKIIRFFVAFVVAVCLSCFESHADDCVLGTDGCAPEFTVTTTELSAGTTFSFEISAAGTYYIDWGDGGAIETIVKGTVGEQTITHTYTNAGQYTIGMSGQATLYSTSNATAAISFEENKNISGISGSLGAIFGTLTDRVNSDGTLMSDAQPRFYYTFYNCSKLSGSIPENLFAGIKGKPADRMFMYTFSGCSNLSGSIPGNLFAGIKGKPADGMFMYTFSYCSNLSGNIPENLFAGIKGAPASYMFSGTFSNCDGLSGSIPENLFAGISGAPADSMFLNTFSGCDGLSGSIPENLFAGIKGKPASYMFSYTFAYCRGLSGSIPENLFAGIKGAPADYMFYQTFYGCSGLSGYVPANLFAAIDKTTTASNQMNYVFNGTGLATSCPADTYKYLTGFESYFNNKVACEVCPDNFPDSTSGDNATIDKCYTTCPEKADDPVALGHKYYTIDGLGNAESCKYKSEIPEPEFIITTTDLSAGTEFSFTISAAGTYDIDWGDGGAIETIVKNWVGRQTITHTYTNAGQYTIGMSGQATLYSTGNTTAAIGFRENKNISGISGSLGAIFGTLTDRVNSDGTLMSDAQPRFYDTFYGCSNLSGNIPENLFAGISGAPADYMFSHTFVGCTGLSGSIPENLFAGISGAPADYMFFNTFSGCGGLSGSIPENLFAGISGAPASYMFGSTFANCGGLSGSIPENLFAGISGAPAVGMFVNTFYNCRGLSGSIPENLFVGIKGAPASNMFDNTFSGCSGLSGYVPANLFAGIDKTTTASDQMAYVFDYTGLATSCPASMYQYLTGFESYFDGKVACSACPADYPNSDSGATSENECYRKCTTDDVAGAPSVTGNNYYGTGVDTCQEAVYYISAGEYLPAGGEEPVDCPSGYYCPGVGDVRWDEKNDQGLVLCPTDFPNSDSGAKTESDCYKPCKTEDVPGATGEVTGNNYYGSNGSTCEVTECMAGWMLQDLTGTIKNASGSNSTYINNNGDITDSENKGLAYYGISDKNSFAVDYGKRGILTGHGRCSTQKGVYNFDWNTYTLTDVTVLDSLADETGMDGAQYCYCQVDGFTPVGELTQMLSDQPWVYYRNHWDSGSCANDCARTCSDLLRGNGDEGMAMRQVLFGPSMCVQASYRLNAGTYLPAGEDVPTKCPVGYYCPRVVNVKPDEENDQGLFQCPVDYPDSDEGAMGDTYCYTSCKLENMDAENIIAVTGKDYYGTGADTCVPSECAAGWIVQDLTGIAGQDYALNSAYVGTNSGVVGLVDSNGRDMMYYGISELNSFALDFGSKGIITGRARCSSIEGTNNDYTWTDPTILDELADETGQEGAYHCYCQVDGFTMPNKVVQQVSGPWVYRSNYWGDYEYCASSCAGNCAQQLKYNNSDNMAFRKAMFVPTMCVQESYRINAGTYLPAGDDAPAKCPVGYYCPGVVNVKLDEENDQGLSKCPSEYPNSDEGATADTQCYTKCTINDVANSMTVVGDNYYGTGTDTCEAIECAPGWLLDLGLGEYAVCADTLSYIEPGTYLPAGKTVVEICLPGSYCPGADNVVYNVDADQGIFACPTEYPNSYTGAKADTECYQTCKIDNGDVTTSGNGNIYYGDENNTCELTECADGWMLKDFAKKIGTESGINSAYVSTNSMSYGQFVEEEWINDSVMGQMYYGISEPGEFAVGFGENGVITGRGRCSTKSGVKNYDWGTQEYSEITTFDELDDESGNDDARYCYCHVDSYTSVGGLTQVLSGMPWVFNSESWSGEGCNSYCAAECVSIIRNNYTENIAFRAVAFGAKPQDPAICIEESYRLNPGMYLMAGEDTPTKCPSGSYCPGAGDVILNSDKNQGIVKCPSGYPYSDTGATDDTQCYSLCTTDDVANSTSVIGNDYYGDGTDTCAATQCVAGWKLRDLSAIIGTASGLNSAYISTNSSSYGEFRDSAGLNQDYYGLSEIGSFAVDYGDTGIITGRARCSTKPGVGGANPTVFKELDDESGVDGAQYCYCQVNGYFKQGELIQAISGPWVYYGNCSSDGTSMCEGSCGSYLKWNGTNELAFRSVMFGGATCEQTKYRLNAGTYLPAGKESIEQCVSGSYCPGADNITIDANNNQGIVACPSGYPKSDIGAKADTQCYTDCTTQDVEHAMTVVGNDYYGDGNDMCMVTECVSGWHVKSGLNLEELVGSTYEGSNSSYMAGTNSAYINNAGDFVEYGQYEEYGQEYYGISENNSFAVIYDDDKGMITGRARCSSQSENSVENLPDESGNSDAYNCYCTIDSYTPVDGTKQTISAPWIKYGSISWYPGACESNCVQNCASNMREHMTLDFRGKMFDAAYELPVCSVNQININWNLGYGDNNVSTTTCSYTDVIEYPTDPVRPGYTFTGWKLVE